MAKNMITIQKSAKPFRQSGFSLVELLVAALILAIGILGVIMLQAMALRTARGSGNMGTAARIAGQIVDQAEMEGRLSWLNITDANLVGPTNSDLGLTTKYISIPSDTSYTETFTFGGEPVTQEGDTAFFTVTTRRVEDSSSGGSNTVGKISDFQVRVTFIDSVNVNKESISRTFNLSRRIIHG